MNRTTTLIAAFATTALAASTEAASIIDPGKIVSGSATGTLVVIDAPFANNTPGGPVWAGPGTSQADQGFTTLNSNLRDYRPNDLLWEPDGTDPAEAGSWFTYPASPSVAWNFGPDSGIDIVDGSTINAIYAVWFSRNRDGITYAYTEGAQSDSFVDDQNPASLGDLVISWTDSLNVVRNANFQRIFNTPIIVEGGDGFVLTGSDNVGNAAHIDAVIIDVSAPANAIPEPTSMVVGLAGLAGLCVRRRRS